MIFTSFCFSIPDRDIYYNLGGYSGIVPFIGVYGSFSGYTFKNSKDHMWNIRFGGSVIFWGDGIRNVGFRFDSELIADPESPIFFRPRAIYFSEGFYFTYKSLTISYIHRCKHDIENLFRKEQRTLIISGPRISYNFKSFILYSDFYPLYLDEAEPPNLKRINAKDLKFALGFISKKELENIMILQFLKMDLLKRPHFNLGFDISYFIKGEKGNLLLFWNFEHFYETGMNPHTSSALLTRLGLRSQNF